MIKIVVLLLCVISFSCTSKTEFGECIGAFDDREPNKVYKVSANNLFWGIIAFGLIFPPIDVVVNKTLCPVGVKKNGVQDGK